MAEEDLTIDQALEAMRYFLAEFNTREPPEFRRVIQDIISWTDRTVWDDGGTVDPAQWESWLEAVEAARRKPYRYEGPL